MLASFYHLEPIDTLGLLRPGQPATEPRCAVCSSLLLIRALERILIRDEAETSLLAVLIRMQISPNSHDLNS